MEFRKCVECGTEYLFPRRRCSGCGSEDFEKIPALNGVVEDSVHLIATPEPFPEEYSIILFRTEGGGKGFCRSDTDIEPGTGIAVTEDDSGPVCTVG